ncbi:ribosomal protein L25/Gln-tRNA synthetase [Pelagophyceae sp. CCMP2097]|nr:ribosomal protein L25/Gln-tRNA synthetase [Pelagophyceae sp. CCMP2097]
MLFQRLLASARCASRRTGLRRFSAEYTRIPAELRTEDGTRKCEEMRQAGRLPSVLYGVSDEGVFERKLLTISLRDIQREVRVHQSSIENTMFMLDVSDGTSELVLARQIQVKAASDTLLSCNFLRYSKGMIVQFPLKYVDTEKNSFLKRAGYLHRQMYYAKVKCFVPDLPKYLAISAAEGHKNHVFRMKHIQVPGGLVAPWLHKGHEKDAERVVAVIKAN